MTLDDFIASIDADDPPTGLTSPLCALWYQRKGDFDRAHELVQADKGCDAAWVHAFLHRLEGDHSNAAYWYNRAARPASTLSLDKEWRMIASGLLHE